VSSVSFVVFFALVLSAGASGYVAGWLTGKRAERRRWEQRIAWQVRELGRTRDIVHRALEGRAPR
jgi:hypothetical protein